MLGATLLAATAAAAGGMDAADLRALERLKGANPHACAKLRSWGAAGVDPCAWPGVTCTAADGDAARRVQVVDLRYCGLTSLPADALVMDKLEVLEVRGNAIAALPPTVGHLTSLQRIMIEFNELTELPKEICMPQLQRLYIAYNKLTALPECIGEITALNDIWLRGNSIATIPDSFCKLRQHISGYMMMAGIQHLPDCIGDVPFSFLYLYGNELSELPDSMQQIYAAHDGFELSLADNKLTALPAWVATTPQIGSINVEGNRLTSLPTALPPHLTSLRLGGNPIVNVTNAALVSLLQAAPDLDTFSLRYAPPGLTHNPSWMDPESYVVKTMPTAGGIASCPSSLDPHADASCPFIIRAQQPPPRVAPTAGRRLLSLLSSSLVTSDRRHARAETTGIGAYSDKLSSGGLELHYCLNRTLEEGGCACEHNAPPLPADCVPLTDNHDGSYSGVIDGHTVGAAPTASFRFFQRSADGSPNSALVEVVIGYWGDGTACVGSKADPTFQSHGGNCFKDVRFELDCTAHGEAAPPPDHQRCLIRAASRLLPMAETSCCTLSGPFAQASVGGCECQPGFVKLEAANGRWQCNQPAASGGSEGCPGWVTWVLAACIAVTLCSIAFASAPQPPLVASCSATRDTSGEVLSTN